MQNITSTIELKNAIQVLAAEHTIQGQLLKEHLLLTYKSFKPVNLLRSTLQEVTSSPYIIENILGAVLGLATGYLSKKIVVAGSGNIFRKLLGSVLQVGVTNFVSQHPEGIKSIGQYIFQHIFNKKERVSSEYGE
jgi:hypothetical protein